MAEVFELLASKSETLSLNPSTTQNQNQNHPMKKGTNKLNRKFCSASLAIKEMEIKPTLRFHLTPVRWQSSAPTKVLRTWGKRNLLHC
jgi:hypothetical protein